MGIFRPNLGEHYKRKKFSANSLCQFYAMTKKVFAILQSRFSAEIWNGQGIIFIKLERSTMIGTSYEIDFSFFLSHIILLG